MRILFVSDHAGELGGAEKSMITLIRKLIERGHNIYCILPQKGETYRLLNSYGVNLKTIPMPTIERSYNAFKVLYWIWALLSFGFIAGLWCRMKKIDIIHANKTPCVFYSVAASMFACLPVVWHVRNFNRRFGLIGSMLFKYVDAVVCISHAIAKPFFDSFPDFPEKIQVVYNGVIIDPLKKISLRSENLFDELKISKPAFIVGVLGRITAWKKIEVFLKAMNYITQQTTTPVYGVIIGDCITSKEKQMRVDLIYKNYLLDLYQKLQLTNRVSFLGFKKDIETYMSELDILVLPSENEPFGRVLIESMSLGIPVIAADSGAVSEIIVHNETGVLFPCGDDQALADQILRLFNDPLLLRRIAKGGWKRVNDHFSADTYASNIETLYQSLLV